MARAPIGLRIKERRKARGVTQAALARADVVTVPPGVFRKLADHPLTKQGVDQFVADWKSTGQSIL